MRYNTERVYREKNLQPSDCVYITDITAEYLTANRYTDVYIIIESMSDFTEHEAECEIVKDFRKRLMYIRYVLFVDFENYHKMEQIALYMEHKALLYVVRWIAQDKPLPDTRPSKFISWTAYGNHRKYKNKGATLEKHLEQKYGQGIILYEKSAYDNGRYTTNRDCNYAKSIFTPEELDELKKYDDFIDQTFTEPNMQEIRFSMWLDYQTLRSRYTDEEELRKAWADYIKGDSAYEKQIELRRGQIARRKKKLEDNPELAKEAYEKRKKRLPKEYNKRTNKRLKKNGGTYGKA